jgi:branched-chain amino acid transport system substrate-binding protein
MSSKLKKTTLMVFCMFLLVLLAACGSSSDGTPAPQQPEEVKPIKIGVLGALQLTAGKEIENAAAIAIEEINEAGGILGRPVEVIYEDTKASAEQARAAVEKLIFRDKVDFLIGEHRSEASLVIQTVAAENKIIYINTGAASPLVGDKVAENYDKGYKYTFRPFLTSQQLGDGFAEQLQWVLESKGYDKVAVLAETAVWVEPIVENFKETLGDKLVLLERPATDAKDFSIELSKIAQSKAQVVFTLFSADQGIVFARQWADRQIPAVTTGYTVQAQSGEFWSQTEGKANSLMTWKYGVRAPVTEKSIPYWDKFTETYGRPPGPYTAISTYDAVWMLAEAIELTGEFNNDGIVEALENNTFVGAAGNIKFDEKHDILLGTDFIPFTYIQWQDGNMTTVWPEKFATGEMIVPSWLK